jgi:hypothetical protein
MGSQTGRNAIALVFLKYFAYLVVDLTKTDGATFDNDAKGCFDRSISALANLRSRQLGMLRSACHMCAELLLKVSYNLETRAGISDHPYSPAVEQPLYSEGQGSRYRSIYLTSMCYSLPTEVSILPVCATVYLLLASLDKN